jgi:hypothetical protein
VCQNEAENFFEGRPAGFDIVEGDFEGLKCVVCKRRSTYVIEVSHRVRAIR